MCTQQLKTLNYFLSNWKDCPAKESFLKLKDFLLSKEDVIVDFKAREGISYSLRAKHKNQVKRQVFVMIDVIDDDPENRWLSICFYGDMITDPEQKEI